MNTRALPLYVTIAIFLLAYAICWTQFPTMLSTRVIGNLLTDNAYLGIVAVGMTLVILSGGIDLSVGSVIAFSGVFIAVLLRDTSLHPLVVFAMLLVITTAFGAAMGFLIDRLAMPAFIVTLAGMFLARGAAYMLSIQSVPIANPFFQALQSTYWLMPGKGRLTLIGVLMVLIFIVGMIVAHKTRFGTSVYALGGGETTARLMGVRQGRTTVLVYAFSGLTAGLSGIVFTIYTGSGYSLATVGTELTAIAAVVIGGTLLTGGAGYMFGTFIGVLTMGLIQTYIVFDGSLSSWWTKIVIGILLLAFILLQKGLLKLSQDRLAAGGQG
ncbi:monosaccharide ABC transporter membrane protein, CUT2 family [Paracoccus alcaliphilus]|uniref:Monosaccharide ABC transporter membrane protein, CUT2 family n=1 Tax=Paracoccus alcaliphilus TaxID=34002 RepID=A0A1H8FUL2_9RHOB|nr:galactofuranose ABC transporter, permease protein YjfF [Paracoccus alcaliphilus]WCR20206.1 sugar ABC transporter permease YjfF [Paracoccus alcaliphilus]SEN35329.1 monosaccharide ABC transporter membrane protein, CUT2 family [Paracoccus alcaliphilus]